MTTCPICHGDSYYLKDGVVTDCPNGCQHPNPLPPGQTYEDAILAFGGRFSGGSIVRPRPLMGDPYDGNQS